MNKFIILTTLYFMMGCQLYLDDNPLEEYLEEVIQDNTGIEVDFSGRSPEKDPYNERRLL